MSEHEKTRGGQGSGERLREGLKEALATLAMLLLLGTNVVLSGGLAEAQQALHSAARWSRQTVGTVRGVLEALKAPQAGQAPTHRRFTLPGGVRVRLDTGPHGVRLHARTAECQLSLRLRYEAPGRVHSSERSHSSRASAASRASRPGVRSAQAS